MSLAHLLPRGGAAHPSGRLSHRRPPFHPTHHRCTPRPPRRACGGEGGGRGGGWAATGGSGGASDGCCCVSGTPHAGGWPCCRPRPCSAAPPGRPPRPRRPWWSPALATRAPRRPSRARSGQQQLRGGGGDGGGGGGGGGCSPGRRRRHGDARGCGRRRRWSSGVWCPVAVTAGGAGAPADAPRRRRHHVGDRGGRGGGAARVYPHHHPAARTPRGVYAGQGTRCAFQGVFHTGALALYRHGGGCGSPLVASCLCRRGGMEGV